MEKIKVIGTTVENKTEIIEANSLINAEQIGMIKKEMSLWIDYHVE
mgnify:CR=1 FL=1